MKWMIYQLYIDLHKEGKGKSHKSCCLCSFVGDLLTCQRLEFICLMHKNYCLRDRNPARQRAAMHPIFLLHLICACTFHLSICNLHYTNIYHDLVGSTCSSGLGARHMKLRLELYCGALVQDLMRRIKTKT